MPLVSEYDVPAGMYIIHVPDGLVARHESAVPTLRVPVGQLVAMLRYVSSTAVKPAGQVVDGVAAFATHGNSKNKIRYFFISSPIFNHSKYWCRITYYAMPVCQLNIGSKWTRTGSHTRIPSDTSTPNTPIATAQVTTCDTNNLQHRLMQDTDLLKSMPWCLMNQQAKRSCHSKQRIRLCL